MELFSLTMIVESIHKNYAKQLGIYSTYDNAKDARTQLIEQCYADLKTKYETVEINLFDNNGYPPSVIYVDNSGKVISIDFSIDRFTLDETKDYNDYNDYND